MPASRHPSLLLMLLLAFPAFAGAGTATEARYVGQPACAGCHAAEAEAWRGSHHDLAMQEAAVATVLGNFADAHLDHFGLTTRFFRDGDNFMVHTDGPDGTLRDYRIAYTFGVYPLQQYLVEFPGGRLQALDIAWDSRSAEDGGQRWFHLHPEDPVRHGDVLHWTGPNLNWNYMCADCHSTNLRKGYDAGSDSYDTTWSEIDVACEACHGPGSAHVEWAWAAEQGQAPALADKGLTVMLDERKGAEWRMDPASGRLQRSRPRSSEREIEVCARCHSRRSQLTDNHAAGQPLLDGFRPALLTEGLYHPDGQIEDEVYVWGSFVQSRMHQAGLTCSDCHDPHTADVRLPGDLVCRQCHADPRYVSSDHHFHPPESTGARCVECHMPPTTYMRVDDRHDHSARIPRPDLSVALGVPNACNRCHDDQNAQWAAQQVLAWYGEQPTGLQEYAAALAGGRLGHADARASLQALVADPAQPAIARATALGALRDYPDRNTLMVIQQALNADDALQRLGALDALQGFDPRARILALPLLWDERRSVRISAARLLAGIQHRQMTPERQARLDDVIGEYIAVQRFNAERPEAQLNLAGVFADLGRPVEAEQAYRHALRLQPQYVPAYVNFAQFLSTAGREHEADGVLRSGLQRIPDDAALEHALGLSLVRRQKSDEALDYLGSAAEHAPDNARYSYVYAVGLQSVGRLDDALGVLQQAHRRHPADPETLHALTTFNRDAGRLDDARRYAHRLAALLPGNPAVQRLVRSLDEPGS